MAHMRSKRISRPLLIGCFPNRHNVVNAYKGGRYMEVPSMGRLPAIIASASLSLVVYGCGDKAQLPADAGVGPQPEIPEPRHEAIPTVHIAAAKGWANGATPRAAEGLTVRAFADGLDHPRWLYVLPNGDVLVAETNAPPKPEDGKGITAWFVKQ